MSKLNLTHLEGVQIHGVGRQEGGGPQGHPGGDLGLVERPGHAEPPPKKTAQFLTGAKKQIGSHFGFSSAWKK